MIISYKLYKFGSVTVIYEMDNDLHLTFIYVICLYI